MIPSHRLGAVVVSRTGEDDAEGVPPHVAAFDRVVDALEAAALDIRGDLRADGPSARRAVVDVTDVGDGDHPPAATDRATALLAAARKGQLLLTGVAAELLDDAPADIELVDLGSHRFHALPRPLSVFLASGPGLSGEPIRALDTVAAGLPVPPTPLVGRVALLPQLVAIVCDDRLVTVVGSGGTGKTRMALEVALASASSFDAVDWVELAPLGTESEVVEELAHRLDVHRPNHADRRAQVVHRLAEGRRLVVLDNAEHLIDTVTDLAGDLLRSAPHLHLLVTSREPLGTAVETVRRIPSLELAGDEGPATIAASEAVTFLLDRLRRAGIDTTHPEFDLLLAHRICTRLDGIPLALELAAARAGAMSMRELAAGLDDRFDTLAFGRRDGHPRHRTIEASIRWSYDLLSRDEQRLLRRTAVFASDFEPSDAVEVCGNGLSQAAQIVSRLVERSLVVASPDGRLTLLETVRSFAEDRLVEAGELPLLRDEHLQWVLRRTESLGSGFDGPEPQRAAMTARRLAKDCRAAFRHAEATDRHGELWKLLEQLQWAFFYGGDLDEGLDWFDRAVRATPGTDPAVAAPGLVAGALLATSRGDHDEIVSAIERAATASTDAGDRRSLGRSLILQGAHLAWNRPEEGAALISEGRSIAIQAGDELWAAWGSCGAALALSFLGRPADALAALDEADRVATRLRARRLALDIAARRCISEHQLGRWRDAAATVTTGRRLAEGLTAISVTACFDAVEAWIGAAAGDAGQAAASMAEATDRYMRAGELQFVPLLVDARGRSLVAVGRAHEAIDPILALRAHPGVEYATVYRHWLDHTLACALTAADRPAEARAVAERLVADAGAVGNALDAARGRTLLARLDLRDGEVRRTELLAHDALATLWDLGALPAVLEVLDLLADVDDALGRGARATAVRSGVKRSRHQLADHDQPAVTDVADLVEVVRRTRGGRGRPHTGWDSLTPTEVAVVALVAEGLTNPQIAERLVVGRATVKTHVSSALTKTGLAGRTQLATEYRARTPA